ncbi:MAG TPA: 2-oxoglutarate and iron-dependent oxygenase domain-containing protein [Candidatus Kapabacteria bacterium]|nr:2-oxoglutarate and iron-dependent oxygenase domain-containing protein [Candidatus Kapabacteria bacterium]
MTQTSSTVMPAAELPIVDVASLVGNDASGEGVMRADAGRRRAAEAIGAACRDHGFFYVTGHGVEEEAALRLEGLSREFFARDTNEKMRIGMALGGRAWRGYFPVGAELTSGRPDRKEGIYFGAELPESHPAVLAGTPLHGRNLFPDLPGFREAVLEYMAALTRLGHALMSGISMSLGLAETYCADRYTADPLVLFRIFNYPAPEPSGRSADPAWGAGEHTDYGLLTILRQDEIGGLEVAGQNGWITAPPVPGSFVCNIGDMLERLTGGLYRSTLHRVRPSRDRDRLSLPFFFDPNFDAVMRPIEGIEATTDERGRWDGASLHEFGGTYGEYLLAKVAKVFPELGREVM